VERCQSTLGSLGAGKAGLGSTGAVAPPPSRRRTLQRSIQTGVGANPSHPGALALDDQLPPRAGLGAAFAGVMGYARSLADHAKGDPVGAVHEYRKAVRRGRALLRLARPIMARAAFRALNAELRKALAASSPVRDAHVLTEALRWLPARTGAAARAAARQALEVVPRPRKGAEEEVLRRGAWALRALPERFFDALPRDVSWADLSSGLRESYRRSRKALQRSERSGEQDSLHDFRKRVKELRYQLELFEAAGEGRPRRATRGLASLAQRLGAATDLIALRRLAVSLPGIESADGRRLARAIDARVAVLAARELPRARKLFRERPKRFAARALSRLR
jgi:CHAD domain-containing protein